MIRLLVIICLVCYTSQGQPQINEVCPDNEELLAASDGKYYDWIEIYNNSDESIQLSNYHISDDIDDLQKWNFKPQLLDAKSYLILFASDKDSLITEQQHTNFKLSSSGETLYLSDSNGLIDTMEFGTVNEDYTYGRLEESSEIKTNLAKPTPNESNSISGTIIANKESGYYNENFDLTLTAAEGQNIYYTTNGDDPTLESKLYDGKIEIKDEYEKDEYLDIPTTPPDSANCTIDWSPPKGEIPRCKVISYCIIDSNETRNNVFRQSFYFHDIHKLPVASIITDNYNLFSKDSGLFVSGNEFDISNPCWSGNYFKRDWEKPATIEFFINGKTIFHEEAGIRLNGGSTRAAPQKSLRFYARKKYGINKFKNVFFDEATVKEFNSLVIRSTMSCWSRTLIKDALTLSCIQNLDQEKTFVKPIVVYINGNYWGISELRNRLDEDYLGDKYKLEKDSINIVSVDNKNFPRNGSYDEFEEIYQFVKENDISMDENYQFVKDNLDIDSFIDYYIIEMYFANYDWPGTNFLIWNGTGKHKKYKPLFYDIDAGWHNPELDMFEHTNQLENEKWPNPKSMNLFQQGLLSNDEFRNKFINRSLELIEDYFKFENIKSKIDSFLITYGSEIDNNINRFGFPKSKEEWLFRVNNKLTEFARERECYFRSQMRQFFDLDYSIVCLGSNVELDENELVTLSPNPATNFITIENIDSDYVSVINMQGIELMRIESKFKKSIRIDIKTFVKGVYFVKTENKIIKFIKIH